MPGKHRPHTPYTSEAQTIAGNIALAAREGKIPMSKLKGASEQMAKGMTLKELKSHSAEAKGKDLPYKKTGNALRNAVMGSSSVVVSVARAKRKKG
jgi:hypothetical protein